MFCIHVCKVLGRLRDSTEEKRLLTAFLSFPFKGKRVKNKSSKQQQQNQVRVSFFKAPRDCNIMVWPSFGEDDERKKNPVSDKYIQV